MYKSINLPSNKRFQIATFLWPDKYFTADFSVYPNYTSPTAYKLNQSELITIKLAVAFRQLLKLKSWRFEIRKRLKHYADYRKIDVTLFFYFAFFFIKVDVGTLPFNLFRKYRSAYDLANAEKRYHEQELVKKSITGVGNNPILLKHLRKRLHQI